MRDQSTSTNPSASTTRAAIYIRVSSAPQEAHYGPDVQEQACRAYCAEHGISVVGVWHDTLPGTVIDRPGLDALLAAGRRGEADIIVFYKQDRLGRGEAFTIQKYRCKSAGLALHCPLEPLKDGLAGDVEHFARSLVSGEEARNIRLRTQSGRKARAEAGLLLPGSRPLYGYRWCEAGGREKAAYRIDDDTAPVVRRIYRELGQGRPTRGIADALNRDGVPPPNGGRLWRRSTVRDVAKNPRYMGQGEGNRRRLERDPETGGMKRLAEELPGVPLAAGVIPPLVTPDDWHGVQARLAANKVAAIRNNRDPEAYLLRAGHVVCGQCGRTAMTYVKHLTGRDVPRYRVLKDRERHPRCANVQVDAQELDAAAWALVMRILAEPARLLDRLAQGDGDNPDEAELASIERALAGADRGVANLTDGIAQADDDATRGALVVVLKAEAARRDALADRRDTLSARLAEAAGRRANLDDLRAWIEQTRAVLARGPWPVLTTERSSSGGRRLAIDLGQLSAEEEEQLKAWGDNPPCPPEGWVPDPDIAALLGLQLQHAKEQYERQPSYEERREAIRALGLVAILNAPGSDPPYTFRTTHDVGTVVTASTSRASGCR